MDDLSEGESPRLGGVDVGHVRVLAESEVELPPIVVHRPTMRVVDGAHRLRAAVVRGDREIAVRFLEGSEESAFVFGLRANIAHGLPLSLADRKAAAVRVLRSYPGWSDRAVAAASGLAARTVSELRRASTAEGLHLVRRVGRDGRVRPLDSTDGRRRAFELMARRPEASLREVAREVGISPGTVKDVRDRMNRGVDPVLAQQRPGRRGAPDPVGGPFPVDKPAASRVVPAVDHQAVLRSVQQDPSLRFTESGRVVLRWLTACAVGRDKWESLADKLPAHLTDLVAALARGCAADLTGFAARLEGRGRASA